MFVSETTVFCFSKQLKWLVLVLFFSLLSSLLSTHLCLILLIGKWLSNHHLKIRQFCHKKLLPKICLFVFPSIWLIHIGTIFPEHDIVFCSLLRSYKVFFTILLIINFQLDIFTKRFYKFFNFFFFRLIFLKDFSTTFENEVSSFGKENLLKMLFNLYLLGMQFRFSSQKMLRGK